MNYRFFLLDGLRDGGGVITDTSDDDEGQLSMTEDLDDIDDTKDADDGPGDTKPDTSDVDDDTKDDTPGPDAELLSKYGLEAYETTDKALEALKHNSTTLRQKQQETSELRRILAAVTTPKADPEITGEQLLETFDDDPIGSMKKAGFTQKTDLEQMQKNVESVMRQNQIMGLSQKLSQLPGMTDIAKHIGDNAHDPDTAFNIPEGKNETWDKIVKHYRSSAFNKSSFMDSVDVMHKLSYVPSTTTTAEDNDPPPTVKVSQRKKGQAVTASGNKGSSRVKLGPPDYSDPVKWPAAKIKEDMRKRGLSF